MRILGRTDVTSRIGHADVIGLMRRVFEEFAADRVQLPDRTALDGAGENDTVLVMPAAVASAGGLGAKIISIFPSNVSRHLPTIASQILLLDAETGAVRALVDGASVTELRTSAVSALATDILARPDAATLGVFGAGVQARNHVLAVAEVRDLREVLVFSRTPAHAAQMCDDLRQNFQGRVIFSVTDDAASLVRSSDIIVTATTSRHPVFNGADLVPGTHVNAIGSFKPFVRELDDITVTKGTLFADILDHALREAGDLMDPIARGVISSADVVADLPKLVTGVHPGRKDREEITVFKSVGAAMEDIIVAATLCDMVEKEGTP